jgi:hypothetical protein
MTEQEDRGLAIVFFVLFPAVWIGLFLLKIFFGEEVGVWFIPTYHVIPCAILENLTRCRSLVHSDEAGKVRLVRGFCMTLSLRL